MRDLVLLFGFLGLLPLCFLRPYIGVLVWTWFALANPHRETFWLAYDIPYNAVLVLVTMAGWALSNEAKRLPWNWTVGVFFLFVGWTLVTSAFALSPSTSWSFFNFLPSRVFVYILAVLLIINTKARLIGLVWVIAISLGYYGARNGVVGILSGGQDLGGAAFGPPGSMIGDNNHLALALVMVLPILYYLFRFTQNRIARLSVAGVMGLTVIGVLASYSRGGFIALAAMVAFLLIKSNKKLATIVAVLIMAVPAVMFVPQEWRDRMTTIETATEDASFSARLEMWKTTLAIVRDRPIVGGGFKATEVPWVAEKYGDRIKRPRAAHSIYFQILGDHGIVGLVLYVALFYLGWRNASWVIRRTRDRVDLLWAQDLARVMQVSLVGFAVGGAGLSMAYYDFALLLVFMPMILAGLVTRELQPDEAGERVPYRPGAKGRSQPVPAE